MTRMVLCDVHKFKNKAVKGNEGEFIIQPSFQGVTQMEN